MALNATDLAQYISDNKVAAEIVRLQVKTPTVEAAAEAVGVSPEQIGKSILFIAAGSPVLVIAIGNSRVSYRRLAQELNINRRRIKIAEPNEVLAHTGYRVGAVPPFGHIQSLPTFMDSKVLDQDMIFAGGGSIKTLVRISPKEIIRIADVVTAELQGE